MKKTAFVYDEVYNWHNPGSGALHLRADGCVPPDVYYENSNRIRPVKQLLDRSGIVENLVSLKPRPATRCELEFFHTPQYLDKVKALSEGSGGETGPFALVGNGSYEFISLAVGGALRAVEAVMEGEVDNAYALQRPPGRHAERDAGHGFCTFNTFAIAAEHLRRIYGLKKILIIDWDCHHGNGLQHGYYDDSEILYIGVHQDETVPIGIGAADEVGEGAGRGFNVNIPLPAGSGDAAIRSAFEKIIVPIADQFQPEFVIGVAGFANNIYDPLGCMQLTAAGYRDIIKMAQGIADRACNGKLVAIHEGGFGPYMPYCTLGLIEEMSGIKTGTHDPFQAVFDALPQNKVSGDQAAAIQKALAIQSEFWLL
jgi:acetoin utilization deacetylase AcuC-like enzyme